MEPPQHWRRDSAGILRFFHTVTYYGSGRVEKHPMYIEMFLFMFRRKCSGERARGNCCCRHKGKGVFFRMQLRTNMIQ